jgi:hypothetical protein
MYLGIELGLTRETIEEILFQNEKSIFNRNLGVMKEWKKSSKNATILVLMKKQVFLVQAAECCTNVGLFFNLSELPILLS